MVNIENIFFFVVIETMGQWSIKQKGSLGIFFMCLPQFSTRGEPELPWMLGHEAYAIYKANCSTCSHPKQHHFVHTAFPSEPIFYFQRTRLHGSELYSVASRVGRLRSGQRAHQDPLHLTGVQEHNMVLSFCSFQPSHLQLYVFTRTITVCLVYMYNVFRFVYGFCFLYVFHPLNGFGFDNWNAITHVGFFL